MPGTLANELTKTGTCHRTVAAKPVELTSDVVAMAKTQVLKTVREYTPNVIEPSFGIGRILSCLLEHTYWHRPDDVARGGSQNLVGKEWGPRLTKLPFALQVLSLPLLVAPANVLIVPLSTSAELEPRVEALSARLRTLNTANNVNSSGASIGKRYARNDELGTPLSITLDFDTIKDGSVTL